MTNIGVTTSCPVGYLLLKGKQQKDEQVTFYQQAINKSWQLLFGEKVRDYIGHEWSSAYPELSETLASQLLEKAWHSEKGLHCKLKFKKELLADFIWHCSAHKLNEDLLVFNMARENSCEDNTSELGTEDKKFKQKNESLEDEVLTQTRKYESAAQELSSFTYSVSHDLRAPLRRLDGFSEALLNEKYLEHLDETGVHYLQRIRQAARDMGRLIDDLLKLSRISTSELTTQDIDLTELARNTFNELVASREDSTVKFRVEDNLQASADPGLVKILLQNLLDNAIKYSSKQQAPLIEVGKEKQGDGNSPNFYVKDNGVGFDMKYADKLFRPFSRLHSDFEFEGSGIGLATVQRIINIHGGTIWAESKIDEGTTIHFQLTKNLQNDQ